MDLETCGEHRVPPSHGEASPDVHHLVSVASRQRAARMWRVIGARQESEAFGHIAAADRRRIGLVFVQAMARYRLQRAAYVGLSRAGLESLREQRRTSHRVGLPVDAVRIVAADFAMLRAQQRAVPPA